LALTQNASASSIQYANVQNSSGDYSVTISTSVVRGSAVDGREIEFLDGLLPNLYPLAKDGDKDAATLVLKVLALRLQYRRQRIAEDD
jgi:hypothetical protein